MNRENKLPNSFSSGSIILRGFQGAGLAFLVIIIILSPLFKDYGASTMIPIFTVTIGGIFSGIFFHLMEPLRKQNNIKAVVANIVSIIVFIILIWLSSIPGLAAIGLWD